jgi:hypothetical protein
VLPEVVRSYAHEGGYVVAGYPTKQWAYVKCDSCHYDWSLWKLGAPSPTELAA